MKVNIDCDRRFAFGSDEYTGGWYYREALPNERYSEYTDTFPPKSERFAAYVDCRRAVAEAGHELSNAGWRRKLLSWNWHSLSFNNYEHFEIENPSASRWDRHPAFVKLEHRRNKYHEVESRELATAWDDVAEVDFYQRDWTSDGIPFVNGDEVYWSGWWFATLAERDRFLAWLPTQKVSARRVG